MGGFCWTECRYYSNDDILVVNGCHWACPYEYKFFDFSNPLNELLEINTDELYSFEDWPKIDDGVIECLMIDHSTDAEEYQVKTFRRDGFKLVLV